MAITTPTLVGPGLDPVERINPWAVNYFIEDGDPAVELKAAPGAGKAIHLTHVSFSNWSLSSEDVAFTLQDEDGNVLYGPIQTQDAGGALFQKDWEYPMRLVTNKALDVFADDAVTFWIYIEGFTG